jgi:hypothetical protein
MAAVPVSMALEALPEMVEASASGDHISLQVPQSPMDQARKIHSFASSALRSGTQALSPQNIPAGRDREAQAKTEAGSETHAKTSTKA